MVDLLDDFKRVAAADIHRREKHAARVEGRVSARLGIVDAVIAVF